MKIKSAASLAGITTRAVRFYIDEGLIAPETIEHNGRRLVEFSDSDVERLRLIASLRDAMLSVAQIKTILVQPELTGAIFEEYREELAKNFGALSELIGRVNVIDSARLGSPEELRDALSGTQTVEVSKDDAPYEAKPGTCDDGIPPDERRLAYEKWQKNRERRDRLSFLTDWVYAIGEIPTAIFAVIPALLLVGFIGFSIIANLHEEIEVDIDGIGYEFLPGANELDTPVTVKAKGTIYRMYFGDDYYIGSLEVEGHLPWDVFERFSHEGDTVYIDLGERKLGSSNNISLYNQHGKKSYQLEFHKTETRFKLDTLYFNEYGNQLVLTGYEWIPTGSNSQSGKSRYFITAPAENPEFARIDAARILPHKFFADAWYDEYKNAYRRNAG